MGKYQGIMRVDIMSSNIECQTLGSTTLINVLLCTCEGIHNNSVHTYRAQRLMILVGEAVERNLKDTKWRENQESQ